MRNISPTGEICCFLCSACNITHVVSTVKRWVLVFLWRICDSTSPAHLRERAIFQACLIKMAFSWKCIGRQQLLFYTTAGMVSGRFILGISFSTWDLRCNIKSSVASQNSKSIRRIILSITLKQNALGAQLLSALKNLYHNNSFTINRL